MITISIVSALVFALFTLKSEPPGDKPGRENGGQSKLWTGRSDSQCSARSSEFCLACLAHSC